MTSQSMTITFEDYIRKIRAHQVELMYIFCTAEWYMPNRQIYKVLCETIPLKVVPNFIERTAAMVNCHPRII